MWTTPQKTFAPIESFDCVVVAHIPTPFTIAIESLTFVFLGLTPQLLILTPYRLFPDWKAHWPSIPILHALSY